MNFNMLPWIKVKLYSCDAYLYNLQLWFVCSSMLKWQHQVGAVFYHCNFPDPLLFYVGLRLGEEEEHAEQLSIVTWSWLSIQTGAPNRTNFLIIGLLDCQESGCSGNSITC